MVQEVFIINNYNLFNILFYSLSNLINSINDSIFEPNTPLDSS